MLSTNLSHMWEGVRGRVNSLDFELLHEQVGDKGTNGGTHGCTKDLFNFSILTLEKEVSVFKARLQK